MYVPHTQELADIDRLNMLHMFGGKLEPALLFYPFIFSHTDNKFDLNNERGFDALLEAEEGAELSIWEVLGNASFEILPMFKEIVISEFAQQVVVFKQEEDKSKFECYEYMRFDKSLVDTFKLDKKARRLVWSWETSDSILRVNSQQVAYTLDGITKETLIPFIANGKLRMNKGCLCYKILDMWQDAVTGKKGSIREAEHLLLTSGYNNIDMAIMRDYDKTVQERREIAERSIEVDALYVILNYIYSVYAASLHRPVRELLIASDLYGVGFTKTKEKHRSVYNINIDTDRFGRMALNSITYQHTAPTYRVEEWEARGHWRRYKNGKTVWVKASKKRRDAELLDDAERVKQRQRVYNIINRQY
jgi:hypothetical protein